MADLSVRMSLTLADTASGPLRAFVGVMDQLKAATARVAPNLEAIALGIGNVGKAATAAQGITAFAASLGGLATRMTEVRAASTGVAAAVGNIGNRASAAGVSTYALEQAMGSLGGTLSRIVDRLTAAAAGLGRVGTEARAAGAGVRTGAAAMESGLAGTNAQATGLAGTLKGLAALWAAVKVEKFLGTAIKDAGDFTVQVAKVQALNLGAEKTNEIVGKAWDDSKALKFASVLDTIQGRLAAIGGLAQATDQKVIDATLPAAMTLANNLRMMGDKGSMEDMVRNAYGMAEARGQTNDPEAMKRTFDFIQRAYTATGGKINMRDWEAMVRQLGQGASQITDEGLFDLIGVMDQIKIAGGANSGGGAQRVGTAFKMLQAYGLGKPMNKQGAQLFSEAGIIDPAALIPSGDSTLMQNVKPGGFRDAMLLAENPAAWVQKMVPLIMAYMAKNPGRFYQGKDPNDPEAQAVALQKFITSTGVSVTAAQALGIAAQPKTAERIHAQAEMAKNTFGVNETKALLDKTLPQQLENARAAFENLYVVVGTQLLPVLTPLIAKFAEFLRGLAEFGRDHPTITFFNVLGLALGGFLLVAAGIKAVFGPLGQLTAAIRAIGPAAEAGLIGGAVAATVGGASMLATFLKIGAGALKLLLAFDIGYALGEVMMGWLGPMKVSGATISTWIAGWMDSVVTTVANAWIRTKQFFGLMTKAAADAAVGANNAEQNAAWLANQEAPNKHKSSGVVTPYMTAGDFARMDHDRTAVKAAAAALFPSVTGPGKKGGGGRASRYNEGADLAANEFKREEDDLRSNIKVMDALYKSGTLSVENYYIGKQAALEVAVEAEQAALNRERDAFVKAKNQAGINRVETQLSAVQNKLESGTEQNEAAKKEALNKLDRDAIDLQRNLLQSSGQRHAAELLHIQQEMKAKLDVGVLNERFTRAEADAMLAKAKAASDLAEQERASKVTQEGYKQQLIAIDAAERNGLMTGTEAARQRLALHKLEAAALNDILAKELALAEADGNSLKAAQIRTAMAQQTATLGQIDPNVTTVLKSAEQGFTNFFSSILNGTKSVKNAFGSLILSIGQTINDLIAKQLGSALFKSIFPDMASAGGGGAGGGGGGWFSGFLSKLLGGGGAGGGGGYQLSGLSPGLDFPPMPFADGTDYIPRDMLAMVHEGERITPKAFNPAAGYAGGGRAGPAVINQSITINAPGGIDRSTAGQLAARMARAARTESTRGTAG